MPRYVKFMQGTPEAFAKLPRKDSDTLYVIYEEDEINATLYLGSKVIAGGEIDSSLKLVSLLSELKDIKLSNNLADDSLLVYDVAAQGWVNKNPSNMVFVGATDTAPGLAGFVPAPEVGDENTFLSSDGQWKSIIIPQPKEYDASNIYFNTDLITNYEIGNIKLNESGSAEIAAAGKSVAEVFEMIFGGEKIVNDEIAVAIPIDEHGYFTSYAAAVSATEGAGPAGELDTYNYHGEILTVVDETSANLHVIQPDNTLSQVAMMKDLPIVIDTYTKEEIDNKVAAANHLKRKMINTVEEIGLYAEVNPDAEQYIYMVPTGLTLTDNRYDEYMIIPVIDDDGVEIQAIERVGTWEINLEEYVKKSEVEALEKRIAALEALVQGQT